LRPFQIQRIHHGEAFFARIVTKYQAKAVSIHFHGKGDFFVSNC
jgi:hypothetical protein